MFDYQSVCDIVLEEHIACDELIKESLHSNVELISQMGEHIVKSGGKRLRPLLVLLGAKAFGYKGYAHVQLAAIIELLHTATLLHDDVVDHSELRRNKPTANKIWGDQASVLVGDYLYSRAFQLMVKVNSMPVMEILARASNQMAEGEVLQLLNCHNPDVTRESYRKVIHYKTGTLFGAAAQMGPVLMQSSIEMNEIMFHYGIHLGSAFQLVDDALDYSATHVQMGKNMGDDLREGKPTLPFIRALAQSSKEDAQLLREAISTGKTENITSLIKIIESTDAIPYTYKAAQEEANHAKMYLEKIPPSSYRDALFQLVEFAISRQS